MFGIIIGIAAAIFLCSTLLVFHTLWWLWSPLFYCIPFVCTAVGWFASRYKWVPNISWPISLCVALVLWPLCVILPIMTQSIRFDSIWKNEVPQYYMGKEVSYFKSLYVTDSRAGMGGQFQLQDGATSQELVEFYRNECELLGWKEKEKSTFQFSENSTMDSYVFEKKNRRLLIRVGDYGYTVQCDVFFSGS